MEIEWDSQNGFNNLAFGGLKFSALSKEIQKSSRSLHNRIQSIISDSEFVSTVAKIYPEFPLVANERCGRWYIAPSSIQESVYFKSTDGHTNQWDFSTRRLNLHIIDILNTKNGMIVVDSTRRGKRMPDSFSKTIPIWCGVLNNAIFGDPTLHFPNKIVSESETNQILERIPFFTEKLIKSGALELTDTNGIIMRSKIKKKLLPLWVFPGSIGFDITYLEKVKEHYYPIICCTASKMMQDNMDNRNGYTYVQGAADDHEEWAIPEFTPNVLWNNIEQLGKSNLNDEELLTIITTITSKMDLSQNLIFDDISQFISFIIPSEFALSSVNDILSLKLNPEEFSMVLNLSENNQTLPLVPEGINIIKYPISKGKKGSKQLRERLPEIVKSFSKFQNNDNNRNTLILCDTGTDISVGVCLALISLFPPSNFKKALDKDTIRQRLVLISSFRKVNPSRSTLNAVNAFLMS